MDDFFYRFKTLTIKEVKTKQVINSNNTFLTLTVVNGNEEFKISFNLNGELDHIKFEEIKKCLKVVENEELREKEIEGLVKGRKVVAICVGDKFEDTDDESNGEIPIFYDTQDERTGILRTKVKIGKTELSSSIFKV